MEESETEMELHQSIKEWYSCPHETSLSLLWLAATSFAMTGSNIFAGFPGEVGFSDYEDS